MSKSNNGISKKIVNIVFLQLIIVVYTFAGIFAKYASRYSFLSFKFILFYGLEMLVLFLYAILWQQIIKKFSLSVAYSNRSVALIWSMIWASVLFNEKITLFNIIGIVFVIIGMVVVNSDDT